MTKTKLFLILTGYQLTWLACIFGEKNYSEPLIGFFTGLTFLLIYFTYTQNKKKFIYIILSIAILRYFISFMILTSSIIPSLLVRTAPSMTALCARLNPKNGLIT